MKNSKSNAIAILKDDHEKVTKLFKQFKSADNANNDTKKSAIVEKKPRTRFAKRLKSTNKLRPYWLR